MRKAAFLDRDGTIIYNRHYLKDPDGVELLPGAIEGLRQLAAQGYLLVLITNQSGIARGYFTEVDLAAVHGRLVSMLSAAGVSLDGYYYCPHGPAEQCHCRKPQTGMLEKACADLDIDAAQSVMIGDSKVDIDLGKNFGITAIQVTNNFPDAPVLEQPDAVVPTLADAAHWLSVNALLR